MTYEEKNQKNSRPCIRNTCKRYKNILHEMKSIKNWFWLLPQWLQGGIVGALIPLLFPIFSLFPPLNLLEIPAVLLWFRAIDILGKIVGLHNSTFFEPFSPEVKHIGIEVTPVGAVVAAIPVLLIYFFCGVLIAKLIHLFKRKHLMLK